jgi:cyclophilin family peptidyl-prolyl cis-trans isomerase
MMNKLWFNLLPLSVLFVLTCEAGAFGSEIKQMELAQLSDSAEVIVLAQVVKVSEISAEADEVTIRVGAVLKGKLRTGELKVVLTTRGVKDFDPTLKVGDTGVFFLKDVKNKEAKPAYSGSVAVFTKPNFIVSERSYNPMADSVRVKLETSKGDIVLELNRKAAPVTVDNFVTYVKEGFYDGTIFHRVIPNFMVQGGGFAENGKQKETHESIVNEASNGLENKRGTIAMARTSDPDSATSQFFINHRDNSSLDYVKGRNAGYAVFGKVIKGMEIVDNIAVVKTTTRKMTVLNRGREMESNMRDVPAEPVMIKSAKVMSDS